MIAGAGDLDGPLGVFLAFHLAEVGGVVLPLPAASILVAAPRGDATATVQAAVDRTVADNPERPRGFVQAVLASLSEPRTTATPFVPRSRPK